MLRHNIEFGIAVCKKPTVEIQKICIQAKMRTPQSQTIISGDKHGQHSSR